MKASNPEVMVQHTGCLLTKWKKRGMNYPFISVTEGGRRGWQNKICTGNRTLLEDGLGDNPCFITEEPEFEIPV
jgi:4-hydroxy-3-methylbut-2-en-1-yl diphosphate synthase IspG/GcpE